MALSCEYRILPEGILEMVCTGSVDGVAVAQLRRELLRLGSFPGRTLVLDLRKLDSFGVEGVAILAGTARAVRRSGGAIRVLPHQRGGPGAPRDEVGPDPRSAVR